MAAAAPILQVVGVALSAKAVYDGIKEGNFFQAVVGAVGAYYGMQSLGTSATAGGSSGVTGTAEGATNLTAGANQGDIVASQSAAKGLEAGGALNTEALKVSANNMTREAAQKAGLQALSGDAAKSAALDSLNSTADTMGSGLSFTPEDAGMDAMDGLLKQGGDAAKKAGQAIGDAASGTADAAGNVFREDGLLSKGLQFGNDHPMVAQAGMRLAGGYFEGKAKEEMMDRQEQLYYDRLGRRSNQADVGRYNRMQWNPDSRRFEIRRERQNADRPQR